MHMRDRRLLLGVPLMRQPADGRYSVRTSGHDPAFSAGKWLAVAVWVWILAPAVIWLIFG